MIIDETKIGLYRKFTISRADGSSGPGGKHENCDYFVLDLNHDKYAVPALEAYIKACRKKFPHLAADLQEKVILINLSRLKIKPAGPGR